MTDISAGRTAELMKRVGFAGFSMRAEPRFEAQGPRFFLQQCAEAVFHLVELLGCDVETVRYCGAFELGGLRHYWMARRTL